MARLAGSSLGELAHTIEPGSKIPGLPDWECIPTPGNTPGHVAYFRRRDRVLISGDAIVTLRVNSVPGLLLQRPGLSGPPWYTTWSRRTADEWVRALVRLEPTVLAGGHGTPMIGVGTVRALRSFAGLSGEG